MGEIALVVAQAKARVIGVVFPVMLLLVLVFVWDLSRRIRRWFGRSLKAQQDLARATADMADRLERIESKLEEEGKAERQST